MSEKKILIVDDEPHIRLLLEQTLEDLEDAGVEIITAADGDEGLATALEERPDILFLDVMMPKMSGFDVLRSLRAAEEGARIHVVMLTARGQDIDRTEGREAGADQYLTKPFDPDAVLELASEVLGIDA